MKKALVIALMFVLGLGIAAFAGPVTGTWDMSISIDPGATIAGDLFIDLSTSLAVDYTIAGWVFGASSTFDTIGWSAQSFTASGVLGAFAFDATMNFLPRTITSQVYAYTVPVSIGLYYWNDCWLDNADALTIGYGADFDDLTATASVSIAGVSLEGLFFLEGYAGNIAANGYAFYNTGTIAAASTTWVQTAGDTNHVLGFTAATYKTLGSGWRFKASGSAGGINITSYTYFNLSEGFTTDSCKQSLVKKGTYTIASADCDVTFTEQYIYIDGFTFGCAENIAIGLDITCTGFQWIAFEVDDLDLGLCCSGITADFQIKFGTLTKVASLCFAFEVKETSCFEFSVSLDYSGYSITGFTIDSVSLEHTWNGITFSSETLFGSYSSTITDAANQILFMVPRTGVKNAAGTVIPNDADATPRYFDAHCYYTEKYEVWESFTVASEGDSCCGGAFTFSITTSFGTKKTLDSFAWDYQFEDGTVDSHDWYLYDAVVAGTLPTVAGTSGGTDVDGDGAVDDILFPVTSPDTEAEACVYGAKYVAAASDQLFQWASTDVDLSIGIGSAWSLTFGLDIDVYGWNSLAFGFEFTF
jgi:hypothetical protein